MRRVGFTAVCAALGVLAVTVVPASAAPAAASPPRPSVRTGAAGVPAAAAKRSDSLAVRAVQPVAAGDEVVAGRGDSEGWHLFAASSGAPGSWSPLATLAPAVVNPGAVPWTGRQCLTGDGRYVVAVVAPWSANNVPAGMDRGGIAYVVDAHSGIVRPLLTGVSLHYFNPSCGTGSAVALTRYVGADEQTTQLVVADASTALPVSVQTVAGQLTAAVPAPGGGVIAARGAEIVRVSGGQATRLAGVDGQPFDLVANAAGGVDFLVGKDKSATVWTADATGSRQVGTGSFDRLALFLGRSGHTIAAGTASLNATSDIRALPGALPTPEAVSLDGTLTVAAPTTSAAMATGPGGTGRLPLQLQGAGVSGRAWTPDAAAAPTRVLPAFLTDTGTLAAPSAPAAVAAAPRAGAAASAAAVPLSATTTPPYVSQCAVARNDVHLQAMQPNAAMVDWAANMAGRSLLAGAHARPAGFANLGLPPYLPSAQADFPMPALLGPGGKTIPREVLEAVWAQESNFKQASSHSLQGLAGNPLIADYYAAGGGYLVGAATDSTGAPNPDCGYGLGQVTSGMRTGDMSYDLQRKVGVDYAENAAASAQILASKWNELINAGITPNNSDSGILENWYLAVWDYNSGLHPSTSNPWGLGWRNNPANPAYPFNRHPFLHQDITPLAWQVTYDDAARPGDWPYQEKIFGWMEVPLKDSLSGLYSYAGTLMTTAGGLNVQQADAFELARPGRMDFCNATKNQCDPTASGPCTRADLECWWHYPANWCNPLTNICHAGSWESDPSAAEPSPTGATNWFPPICNINTSPGGDGPAGSVIVDTQAGGVNLEGCDPATENWHNDGTFAFTYGDPNNPAAQATDMDLHQLGAGIGGHMWFTHTDEPTDPGGLSYWGLTGTWTPNLAALGNYTVKVFVPATGATATQATYTIDPGYGTPTTVTIDQNAYANAWVNLGTFWLGEHANASLTNLGTTSSADLAFTAMAFVPAAPTAGGCHIDVRAKPVPVFGVLGAKHLFIIYTDATGTPYVYRGGPTGRGDDAPGVFGYIQTYHDLWTAANNVDWYQNGEVVTIDSGPRACGVNMCLADTLTRIQNAQIPYKLFGPNSNTVVRTMLSDCDLPQTKPQNASGNPVNAPGWDTTMPGWNGWNLPLPLA